MRHKFVIMKCNPCMFEGGQEALARKRGVPQRGERVLERGQNAQVVMLKGPWLVVKKNPNTILG
jgi:hypothetical protein